jgi:hypothetical protein
MVSLERIARAASAAALVAAVLMFPAGCSGTGGVPESREQLSIGQIGQMFHFYQKGQKSPPIGPDDIIPLQRQFPAAVESIRSKEVLVFWGVGVSDAPDAASTVLAYHKDVPEQGGEVLMQDGKARKMTADEFKAAAKPAGATTEGLASKTKSGGARGSRK